MSVFGLKEWWTTQCGANEEYDVNSMCMMDSGVMVTVSLSGLVMIFRPAQGAFRPEHLLLESQQEPTLQIESGYFTHTQQHTLAFLHPRSLKVFNLTGTSLRLAYEHKFQRNSYNFTYGKFGSYSREGCDSICVQSSDGALGIYEQEQFACAVQLPGFLVPGPLSYCSFNDSFILCNSNMEIECYRYGRLREAYSNYRQGVSDAFVPEWKVNIGEYALDIQCAKVQGDVDIYILSEHSLFGIKQTGNLRSQKRLAYTPSSMCVYDSGFVAVGSFSSHFLVYKQNNLVWAAKMNSVPVYIKIVDYGVPGLILSLDSNGKLEIAFLGTTPLPYNLAPIAKVQDYQEQDREYRRVMATLNDPTVQRETTDSLVLNATPPSFPGRDLHSYEGYASDNSGTIISTVALDMKMTGGSAREVCIAVQTPLNIYCVESSLSMSNLTSSMIQLNFLTVSELPACSLDVRVSVSYYIGETPRVSSTDFRLPFLQVCEVVNPIKDADFKVTLIARQELPPLQSIFQEFQIPSPNALTVRYYNGDHATIIIGKSGGRFRVQGSGFDAMWLLTEELCRRVGFGALGLDDHVPFKDFYDLIDEHFQLRVAEQTALNSLEKLSQQYTSIQKRLLVRFKEKNPAALNNLDFLLEATHSQLSLASEEVLNLQGHLNVAGLRLSAGVSLVLLLAKLRFGLSEQCIRKLEKYISCKVIEVSKWEEVCNSNMIYLLKTSLAKNQREQSASVGNLDFPSSTEKLKKHITIVFDRVSKIGNL